MSLQLRARVELELRKRRATTQGLPYEFRGGNKAIMESDATERISVGPAECVAGETNVYVPSVGHTLTVEALYKENKPFTVMTMAGVAMAKPPFIKGTARLYRVTSKSGRSFIATGKHLVMTRAGWSYVSDLSFSSQLAEFDFDLPLSSSALDLSGSRQGVRRSWNRGASFPVSYSENHHQYDGRLQTPTGYARGFQTSQVGVLARNHDCLPSGDLVAEREYTRSCQSSFRLSSLGYFHQPECDQDDLFCNGRETLLRDGDLFQRYALSQNMSARLEPSEQQDRNFDSTRSVDIQSTLCLDALDNAQLSVFLGQGDQRSYECSLFQRKCARCLAFALSSDVCSPSLSLPPKSYYTIQWSQVSSIEFEREDAYYDFTVPGAGHYIADGFIHHNTGKTLAWLVYLHRLARQYKGAHFSIIRKKKTDLTGSVIRTFTRDILSKDGWGITKYGGNYPQWYDYPGGSRIWLGGMDDPGKTLSSERDGILAVQAEEFSLSDWEYLTRCITGRGSVMPFTFLGGDCNPGHPTHWIKSRAKIGKLALFTTTHKDNPTLWDGEKWTEQGIRSRKILSNMTGSRRLRLFLGMWAIGEGAIYDIFDETRHKVKAFSPPHLWPRFVGVDPFGAYIGALWLAYDPQNQVLNVYREYYQPFGITTTGHAQNVVDLSAGETIFAWVGGGPSERQARTDWSAAGVPLLAPPITDVWAQIDRVYNLLKTNSLVIHDSCPALLDEIGAYKRKLKNGQPTETIDDKGRFHLLDSLRYAIAWLSGPQEEEPGEIVYNPVMIR